MKKLPCVGGGRRDLEEPLSSGILEKSQRVALDAALVPVRSASDFGIETSGSHGLKVTRVRCFWDLQKV